MENEYGVELDQNGYAPSLLNRHIEYSCQICLKSNAPLQRHEVFHGAYRTKSKNYGLWMNVCNSCHYRIHNSDGRLDIYLKQEAQKVAMKHYDWSTADFRRRFGKNYV